MDDASVCVCGICGCEINWGGDDPQNGSIWSCERCGADFCQKRFADRHGLEAFYRNVREAERLLCPDCYAEDHADTSEALRKRCCGNCKWRTYEPFADDYMCANKYSDYRADLTDKNFCCSRWTAKESAGGEDASETTSC